MAARSAYLLLLLFPFLLNAEAQQLQTAEVSTAEEFQEAVRMGISHIVITQHLNMIDTPRFSETTQADDAMIAIVYSSSGAWTQSIRGNCTEEPDEILDPPRQSSTQCLIQFREDFLELPLEGSKLWISGLYMKLLGVEKRHSTVISLHGGDLYVTECALVGDRLRTRALDVRERRRLYVSDSYIFEFQKDRDGAIRLEAGAIATFRACEFGENQVNPTPTQPTIVAAGPVAGLKSDNVNGHAHVWFQSCTFQASNTADDTTPTAIVAVRSQESQVFSNTFSPEVWNLDLRQELTPWTLTKRLDSEPDGPDVFNGLEFPSEADAFFKEIVSEQSIAIGLPAVVPRTLPAGTRFTARKPYTRAPASHAFLSVRTLSEVFGAAGVLIVLAISGLIWKLCGMRKARMDGKLARLDSGSMIMIPNTRTFTKIPSARLPSNSGLDARLKHLDTQLNTFGPSDLLLDRYQLLGAPGRSVLGQCVVQLALQADEPGLRPHALRFFLFRADYDAEVNMYETTSPVLRSFIPDVVQFCPNQDGAIKDPTGSVLPPFIVSEESESLSGRARNPVDIFTVAQVLGHVSERIAELHGAGYAHRDLNPDNITWQSSTSTWKVTGFNIAARIGEPAPVGCSLLYAAPELAAVLQSTSRVVQVDPAVDAWALGVITFELLLHRPAFAEAKDDEQVLNELIGKEPLPWEEGRISQSDKMALGVFYEAIMKVLVRSSAKRATVQEFACDMWQIFASRGVAEEPVVVETGAYGQG